MSHGEPAWFVHGRIFVTMWDHHHDDRVALFAAAPDGAHEALVSSDDLAQHPMEIHMSSVDLIGVIPRPVDVSAGRSKR